MLNGIPKAKQAVLPTASGCKDVHLNVPLHPMSKKYSITEARSNLPKIVDQAEAGTEVELTRRGKPVAVIISHRQMERLRSERPDLPMSTKRSFEDIRLKT